MFKFTLMANNINSEQEEEPGLEFIIIVYLIFIHFELITIIKQKKYKDLAVFLSFTAISTIYAVSYLFSFDQQINPNNVIESVYGPIAEMIFGE